MTIIVIYGNNPTNPSERWSPATSLTIYKLRRNSSTHYITLPIKSRRPRPKRWEIVSVAAGTTTASSTCSAGAGPGRWTWRPSSSLHQDREAAVHHADEGEAGGADCNPRARAGVTWSGAVEELSAIEPGTQRLFVNDEGLRLEVLVRNNSIAGVEDLCK